MNKDEFLRRLEDALSGEVPASVIRENLNYYADYLSQELGKGRTMDGIIEEIGEPNIEALCIIGRQPVCVRASREKGTPSHVFVIVHSINVQTAAA